MTFDGEGKIAQIRQSWDQGSLLKQLDVIGKTGRNWPIRDSKDQIGLITRCVKGVEGAAGVQETSARNRTRTNSSNIMRDPHASLALFAPREELEAVPQTVVSPYAGNRPRQRSFTEILGDEPEEDETSPSRGRERSQSPSKAIAPKIGAGKNFQPIRLFEADENEEADQETPKASPEKLVRPNPKKYQHFDFADGSDPQDKPQSGVDFDKKPKTKHDSTWSFDDFVTPQKPTATRVLHKAREVRHWGAEEDVVEDSPERKPVAAKPRRDAEAHFEFVDDGPNSTEPRIIGRPRGSAHNTGLGLYENNLYNEDGSAPTPGPAPLGNITNLGGRRKDFHAHFVVADQSPNAGNGNGVKADPSKISDDRKKAVNMMQSNWDAYDESPAQKENSNPNPKKAIDDRGISIAGDGMGGKKGTNRDWLFGDDIEKPLRNVPGKQQKSTKSDNFWDF